MCSGNPFYCFSNCEGDISSIDKDGLHGIFFTLQLVVDDSDYNFLPSIIGIKNYLTDCDLVLTGWAMAHSCSGNALLLKVVEMALSQKCTEQKCLIKIYMYKLYSKTA